MGRTWTASQEAAITLKGKSILVSAAAGSGKTSVLTERIIRTLTDRENPADLSRLLVVTFTRAAAAELKGRIASALTDALAQNPGDKRLSRQLLLLGSAQISTIDSYFQKIVRANFEQLGLPATFRIADEAEILPLGMDVMDGLIEEFYDRYTLSESAPSALGRLKGNRFAEVLDHLMSNRSDGKLNTCLLEFLKNFSSYPEGIGLLHQCAETLRRDAEKPFFETDYGKGLVDHLRSLFGGYTEDLIAFQKALEYDPDIAYKCNAILSSDLSFCRTMTEALEEKDYLRAQAVVFSFIAGRFPTIKNKPEEVTAYQNWRTKFRKEITEKIQAKLTCSAEVITAQMYRTAELCDMLYAFYKEYEARMLAEKNARGILEHNDVRSMLYRLLTDEHGAPSEFAQKLSLQYDAVYIDEYQDVDLVQDRIFALIGGNRRFMVGDIKQSIYGFRGSDPSIFAAYRRAMPLYTDRQAANADGICVFMSDNFRCDRPVIEFTNQVCSFLFSACEESVGYRPQDDLVCSKNAGEKTPAPVQVAVFETLAEEGEEENGNKENSEAVWVAAEISRLLREETLDNGVRITPSDIAILVRTRAQGDAFAKALEELHIPVTSETAKDFLHEPIATDLLNLLRAIDNPYRDLPLSEFLLSPFGGFDLEELTEVREASSNHKALFDAMTAASDKLSPKLFQKTQDMVAWLEKLRKKASVRPADRFLRELYQEERMVAYADDPCFLVLYDQARIYQRTSWCGLYGFLRHIDKLLEGGNISANGFAKAERAVTVMTIHHSKGLEYPVVFLCACGAGFNRTDTYETILFHKNVGCSSKLYNAETGESENTVLRDAVRQEIDAEQTEEGIRTLYVALTRARERLYVTGTLRGAWEKALSNAKGVRRGNRSSVLGCNSFLAWILAAMQEDHAKKADFPCIFQHILSNEVVKGLPYSEEASALEAAPSQAVTDTSAQRYADIKKAHASFSYPLDALRGLPTKVAASKLRPDLLDSLNGEEDDEDTLEAQIALMQAATPSFETLLDDHEKPSATDIGTATHAFLEFCDFQKLYENGIKEEAARLVSLGFISEATANMIHCEQLEDFRKSNLMQWILQADKVRREQKFSMFLPLASLTADSDFAKRLGEQPIFVQGSIDLLLTMSDGRLLLFDYKTDRVFKEEYEKTSLFTARMKEAHGNQLAVYSDAVQMLFGKRPDATFIYSLPLGKAVDIQI
ncbi:MAG: UvrD-helicase domain-containing protein [Clostridia bacterium]|nr:UvrD-helicase domain-containing protein [Clostridia bacterium]